MSRSSSPMASMRIWHVGFILLVLASGCASKPEQGGGGDTTQPSARAGFILLTIDGKEVRLPLDELIYGRRGEGFFVSSDLSATMFGGDFPKDVRLRREKDWEKLIGKPLAIEGTSTGTMESQVEVPGRGLIQIRKGTIVIDRVEFSPLFLHGRITLELEDSGGAKVVHGTISVNAEEDPND